MDHQDFANEAMHVSLVSLIVNIVLTLFKLIAGILGHSLAMITDAVHSASDVFSTAIIMIGISSAANESDEENLHRHERFEFLAGMILALVLVIAGVLLAWLSIARITSGSAGSAAYTPGTIALLAAIISIVCKEAMYHYTMRTAIRCSFDALRTDAWAHRFDAISSVISLLGIIGARMADPILDPVASVFICLFIFKAALDIFLDALSKKASHSWHREEEVIMIARTVPGVDSVDLLHTWHVGKKIYAGMDITVDGTLTLSEAHRIAENVRDTIQQNFEEIDHTSVRVYPPEAERDEITEEGDLPESKNAPDSE